jgi:hypothetical protein
MVWGWEGWVSYGLAISFLGFAGVLWLKLAWEGSQMLQKIRTAFAQHIPTNHVTQRIDALLEQPDSMGQPKLWSWVWLILVLVPLLVIPFHN